MATKKKSTKKKTEKKSAIKETWNNIQGTMRIYGNEFEGKKNTSFIKWSVSLPVKDQDGKIVDNLYIRVKFAGDDANEPEEAGLQTINIEHAFLATDRWVDKKKNEHVDLVLVVIENDCDDKDEDDDDEDEDH